MASTLAEEIARLHLEPGHPYRLRVDDKEIEVRVLSEEQAEEDPDRLIFLNVPPSPNSRIIKPKPVPLRLPAPIIITEDDLKPDPRESNGVRIVRQIYKITYPTGKIYIGKDPFGSARYMGSPNRALVNADFESLSELQRRNYSLHKEILWQSATATEAELAAKEVECIRSYRSNDPSIGYNRWPKFRQGVTGAEASIVGGPQIVFGASASDPGVEPPEVLTDDET